MPEETKIVEHHRLSAAMLQQIEKEVPHVVIPKTELEAGFLLGVQFILKKLRDGYARP